MLAIRRQRGFTLIEMMVVVAIIGIVSALLVSVSSRPIGANARNASDQLVSVINFAKLRAQSTRRVHRVQIEPHRVSVWVASSTGLVLPTLPAPTWALVESTTFPAKVTIADVVVGAVTTTGASISTNTGLLYNLDVRPDSQATASTMYVTDGAHQWRVITYHITGGTYARQYW